MARPAWLPEAVWPFEPLSLDVNDLRVAVHEVGKGPALLFVHTGTWSLIWRDLCASPPLAGPFRDLRLLTIFGERNDPLRFQPRWKALFPGAPQVVVPRGNHYPMCDDPDLVAGAIRSWHRERVAPALGS